MKNNHIYLLLGIFAIILIASCLGGCYREGLSNSVKKDIYQNKKQAYQEFNQEKEKTGMIQPEDDNTNNNGLIGPGGEQWNYGPGGQQQNNSQPNIGPGGQQWIYGPGGEQQSNNYPGESEGEYIDNLHNQYANNYNKDMNDPNVESGDNNSNTNNYSNNQGIPRTQIPKGEEDLYILKSQIVPPVCPVCPPVIACPDKDGGSCPPCPPCARCPEPAFECRKVPNYNSNDEDFLPRPMLNDFSQFGM